MAETRILIADDEARMRRLVADFLKKEGYFVLEAADGEEALEMFFADSGIALIILDVMMPGMDGWAVCREIRKTSRIPIVMLTARGEEADELYGFDQGADEYISKPFSPGILVARVQALLRRSGNGEKRAVKQYKNIEIDETGHDVLLDGSRIDLSPKEFELLLYMSNNQGIVLSRDQILDSVWGYDYSGDARTVDTHIKRLRIKLGEKDEYIQTVRGYGYKFGVPG